MKDNSLLALGMDAIIGADELDSMALALASGGDDDDDDDDTGEMGLDEILGAIRRAKKAKKKKAPNALAVALAKAQILAMLRQGGSHIATSKGAQSIATELCGIPTTVLALGATVTVNVIPTRSMRVQRLEFPEANADNAFVQVNNVFVLGRDQLNGGGPIRCSMLTQTRTDQTLSGRDTAQAGQAIGVVLQNLDGVNPRTIYGGITGPAMG